MMLTPAAPVNQADNTLPAVAGEDAGSPLPAVAGGNGSSHLVSLLGERVLGQMHRGVTSLTAHGGFSGEPKQVPYAVISRGELARLERLIHDVDPAAFLAVGAVHEVLGVGFTLDAERRALAT